MKFPRDVSSQRLVRALKQLGYQEVRQKGSHLRMVHPSPPAHYATIPLHNLLKTGTLHEIVTEVAKARCITVEKFLELL